jgi:hypothetical protein
MDVNKLVRQNKQLKVIAFVAIAMAVFLPTGVAFAANTIFSTDIVDGEVKTADIAASAVTTSKLVTGAVTLAKLGGNAVTGPKVKDGSLTGVDLAANTITGANIAPDAIGSAQVADFGLSNQDVGVLFAQINADGTVANSSGGVTASRIGTGTYQVDFGLVVSSCAPVATQGEAGVGGAGGAIMGATDRSGNANAFFVTARTNANALIDRAFHLIVVC